ncbi:hypothetical protein EGY31_10810 [Burkholderia multivorans]|nr:hypothetical protein EGY31_10810 [Burkholderia multivorans]
MTIRKAAKRASLPITKIERDWGKPGSLLRNSIHGPQKNSLASHFFLSYSSPYPMTRHRHPPDNPTRHRSP